MSRYKERTSLTNAGNCIGLCVPFEASAMSGEWYDDGLRVFLGDLPKPHSVQLAAVDQRVFVVKSYATPIAWKYGDSVVIPEVKYSGTTTRHQNIVREAWT